MKRLNYVSDTADDQGNVLVSGVSHNHDVIAVFACHACECMYSLCPPFIPHVHYFIPHPTSQAFAQSLVYTCTCVGTPYLCELRTVVKRILLITWPLDTVMQPGVNRAQCWVLRTACAYIHLYIRTSGVKQGGRLLYALLCPYTLQLCIVFSCTYVVHCHQWCLSVAVTTGTQLAVLYRVVPLIQR